MIQSMTGYGQADTALQGLHIVTEMKSLNHRYCEIVVRLPQEWMRFEYDIKKRLQSKFKRGRIDVFINMEREEQLGKKAAVNWSAAESYLENAQMLSRKWGLKDPKISHALEWFALPEFISFTETSEFNDSDIADAINDTVDQAAEQLLRMRQREGKNLAGELKGRVMVLQRHHDTMVGLAPMVNDRNRTRLRQRLHEALEDCDAPIDEGRFLTELALLAERASVDEELERLHSHLNQCLQLLYSAEPVGRKLDFLTQELNRELNTIGSKTSSTDIINLVLECKAEVEKIREQVQNIQ